MGLKKLNIKRIYKKNKKNNYNFIYDYFYKGNSLRKTENMADIIFFTLLNINQYFWGI